MIVSVIALEIQYLLTKIIFCYSKSITQSVVIASDYYMAVEVDGHEKVRHYIQPDPFHGRYRIYQAIRTDLYENGQNGYRSFTLEFRYPSVPLRIKIEKFEDEEKVESIQHVDSIYEHKVTARDLASAKEKMRQELFSDYLWAKYKVTLPYAKDDPFINMVLETLTPFFESPTAQAQVRGPGKQLETAIRGVTRKILTPVFESGTTMIDYGNLEESLNELDGLLDDRTLLTVATSHMSHSDILIGLKLVQEVREKFPTIGNFYMPVSTSMVKGLQGLVIQLFYSEGTIPLLAQQNIRPIPVVTENDIKTRHLKPNIAEARKINHAAKEEGSALLIFPEGSVEGGRYDVFGHIKGLQHVTNQFLPYAFQKASEAGRRVVILPVGTTGTNRMLSAESLFLTWESFGAILSHRLLGREKILARAVIGHPFVLQGDLLKNPEDINDRVMYSIAALKPPEERGYYNSAFTVLD